MSRGRSWSRIHDNGWESWSPREVLATSPEYQGRAPRALVWRRRLLSIPCTGPSCLQSTPRPGRALIRNESITVTPVTPSRLTAAPSFNALRARPTRYVVSKVAGLGFRCQDPRRADTAQGHLGEARP